MSAPDAVDQNIQVCLLKLDLVPLMCLRWLGVLDVENEEAHSELRLCEGVGTSVYLNKIVIDNLFRIIVLVHP